MTESGSEAEDIALTKAMRNYSQLRLTPIRENTKVAGKTSFAGNFSGYDEYILMVDKVVDVIWKKPTSLLTPSTSKESDSEVIQARRHYTQAEVDGCVYNLYDDARVQKYLLEQRAFIDNDGGKLLNEDNDICCKERRMGTIVWWVNAFISWYSCISGENL